MNNDEFLMNWLTEVMSKPEAPYFGARVLTLGICLGVLCIGAVSIMGAVISHQCHEPRLIYLKYLLSGLALSSLAIAISLNVFNQYNKVRETYNVQLAEYEQSVAEAHQYAEQMLSVRKEYRILLNGHEVEYDSVKFDMYQVEIDDEKEVIYLAS